ncbi:MAG: hypothetical protein PHE83_10410 [Opitutaceae bacterium]|nr:hypothetical protein [Opitutaceae bacterium]
MIKTCWEVLLRSAPPASPLGNPDTLVFMMDRTLDAFFTAVTSATPRRWLARYPLLCGSLKKTCPCGRNPFLFYYLSGEQALLAIAEKSLPAAPVMPAAEQERILSEVKLTFHYLAQHELQNFCDLCRANCRRSRAGIVAGRRRGPPRMARLRPQPAGARIR